MTVDNLLKRNITKPPFCRFCIENESINHLFFDCVVAKKVWEYIYHFLTLLLMTSLVWLVAGLVRKELP